MVSISCCGDGKWDGIDYANNLFIDAYDTTLAEAYAGGSRKKLKPVWITRTTFSLLLLSCPALKNWLIIG